MAKAEDGKITADILKEGDIGGVVSMLTEVLEETGAQKRTLMDEGFYRWQYRETKSPVVTARAGKRDIGHYPLTTYRFKIGPDVGKAAVIQDLVTRSEFRKMGAFRLMGDRATEVAEERGYDLIYAFPNPNSFPGFIKYHGYTHLLTIPLYVSPLSLSGIVESKFSFLPVGRLFKPFDWIIRLLFEGVSKKIKVVEHDDVPMEIDGLWESIKDSYDSTLVRDADYVRWRFRGRPGTEYRVFTASMEGKTTAYGVLGSGRFFGLPTAVLMDFLYANGKAGRAGLSAIIREMRRASRGRGDALILTAATGGSRTLGLMGVLFRAGFMRVSGILNPRKLKLVVRPIAESAKRYALSKKSWFLTLADWDVL